MKAAEMDIISVKKLGENIKELFRLVIEIYKTGELAEKFKECVVIPMPKNYTMLRTLKP